MGLFSKKKTDPAAQASQQASQAIMNQIANTKLPALPSFTAAQQAQMTPKVTVPSSLPSYLGGGANTVYPAGMPNQLSMIADQLSAGGYGAPADISAQLSGIYRPQTVAPTPVVAPVQPATIAKKPATPVVKKPVTPAVKKPMGFTGALTPRELNTTGGSLNQGSMFNLPSDFINYLNNLPQTNINKR